MRYFGNTKKDERLDELKVVVNTAVETFVEASKKAEESMSFKAFTLRDTDLAAQYSLSDIILTQAAIHLHEYTPHSLEKYTYTTAINEEDDPEEPDKKNLVVWFNFYRRAPPPPEQVELTQEDINPYIKPVEDVSGADISGAEPEPTPEPESKFGPTYDA